MAKIIDCRTEPDAAIAQALAVLANDRPVAIPTETVYGLAADATRAQAITSIYETKGRPRFNPLICHMSSLDMAKHYAVFDPLSERLAEAFWPGPLTLVLPLKPESGIHALATAGLPTVGIRVPIGFAGKLIAALGHPLAAPSANSSGRVSATSAEHVNADLGEKIDLIIDGGDTPVGVESTILKVEGEAVRLLRPGGVSAETIEAVIGRPLVRVADAQRAAIEAPGMLASHYAPDQKVRLNALKARPGEVIVNFGSQSIADLDQAKAVLDLSPAGDLREAAANLFAMLIEADRLGGTGIAFTPVPDHNLGEAINDRLSRAAAPRP